MTPNLPCSISGSTSISFSIGDYITAAPSWVTIDAQTETLTIKSPIVSSERKYSFYINSAKSGYANPTQIPITLIIPKWSPSNCLKCVNSSGDIWEKCISGFFP